MSDIEQHPTPAGTEATWLKMLCSCTSRQEGHTAMLMIPAPRCIMPWGHTLRFRWESGKSDQHCDSTRTCEKSRGPGTVVSPKTSEQFCKITTAKVRESEYGWNWEACYVLWQGSERKNRRTAKTKASPRVKVRQNFSKWDLEKSVWWTKKIRIVLSEFKYLVILTWVIFCLSI